LQDPKSVLDAAGASAPWQVSLQLVNVSTISKDATNLQQGAPQKRTFACGLQIDSRGTSVLILVCRSSSQK
jgi:hypothetical protein